MSFQGRNASSSAPYDADTWAVALVVMVWRCFEMLDHQQHGETRQSLLAAEALLGATELGAVLEATQSLSRALLGCLIQGRDVGHIDVEVQNQIRYLLDHDPCGVVGADLLAVFEHAAAASPDLRTGGDFRRSIGGYGHKLIPAGGYCHIAVGRARRAGGSGFFRLLRRRSAMCPSPQREARGAFGLT